MSITDYEVRSCGFSVRLEGYNFTDALRGTAAQPLGFLQRDKVGFMIQTKEGREKRGGEMSVREAGKRGGDAVRAKYGASFYEEIGRKGGEVTKERHGAEFYENIGQKGGNAVKDKYGPGFYEEIGHKGGQKVKRLIEEAKRSER
jgi:general stress protein YciG